MRQIEFEEINDVENWEHIYENDILPLVMNPTTESVLELVNGINQPLYVEIGEKIGDVLRRPEVLDQLKEICLESANKCETVIRLLNRCNLLRAASIRQMIREVVIEGLNLRMLEPLQIIFHVSVNPAPMSLVQDIYDLLDNDQKEKLVLVYQEFERVKEEVQRRHDEL